MTVDATRLAGRAPEADESRPASPQVQGRMSGVSWSRYEGKAPAEITLSGEARDAELEGFIRLQNPNLTDVRLEQATPVEADAVDIRPDRQWYAVTYLADDGEGHTADR
jgi:hypothetical protein